MFAATMMPLSSKGEHVGVLVRDKFVLVECGGDELVDQCSQPELERCDLFSYGSRAGAHLQGSAVGEEAATRKRRPQEVIEEGVAHGDDSGESGLGGECRFDDLDLEHAFGFAHGGEPDPACPPPSD